MDVSINWNDIYNIPVKLKLTAKAINLITSKEANLHSRMCVFTYYIIFLLGSSLRSTSILWWKLEWGGDSFPWANLFVLLHSGMSQIRKSRPLAWGKSPWTQHRARVFAQRLEWKLSNPRYPNLRHSHGSLLGNWSDNNIAMLKTNSQMIFSIAFTDARSAFGSTFNVQLVTFQKDTWAHMSLTIGC